MRLWCENMKSNGECKYCRKVFSAGAISRHLLACDKRKKANKDGNENIFLIRASEGPFFAYFEINAKATLEKMDDFLRDIWLDCCGHLSAFTIGATRYNSYCEDLESDEKTLKHKLSELLSVNMPFSHEYDFGTTTNLSLKVIEKRKGRVRKVEVIARNNLPEFKCTCGSDAKEICSQCVWDGSGLLCSKCAKKHDCGEEMLLPVVNSPRMGMCGYTGY